MRQQGFGNDGVATQASKPTSIGFCTRGINAVDNLALMDPQDAVYLFNMVPTRFGTRVRDGYQEWATGCGTEVRTIVPYNGASSAADRLFACANDRIYDVTSSTSAPGTEVTWPVASVDSGYCSWQSVTTAAGRFLALCDEQNGYYRYQEASDTWVKTTALEVTGVDPALFAHVCLHKSRLWFTEKGSSRAWYLAADAIIGAATRFDFGNKFTRGGTLVGLFSWTVDGGEGVDDYLVAVSSAGDVIVYKGDDPASASTWSLRGKWFIGPVPRGRRCAGNFGGELYLLSAYGLLPITRLLSGQTIMEENIFVTNRVAPLVKTYMDDYLTNYGWEVKFVPSQNLLMISVPKTASTPFIQLVQELNTKAWSLYRAFPMQTGDTWNGKFYVGTNDGRVVLHTGSVDNRLLSNPTNFIDIDWAGLSAYNDLGQPGVYHRIHTVRPVFLANAAPAFMIRSRYDYDLTEILDALPPSGVTGAALWDTAVWDAAIWGGDLLLYDTPYGGSGIGRAVANAVKGRSRAPTVIVRLDIFADSGNFL
jgi:hypothetical protein